MGTEGVEALKNTKQVTEIVSATWNFLRSKLSNIKTIQHIKLPASFTKTINTYGKNGEYT